MDRQDIHQNNSAYFMANLQNKHYLFLLYNESSWAGRFFMSMINDCQGCGANLEIHGRHTVIDKTINMEFEYCEECFENCMISCPAEFDSSGNLLISWQTSVIHSYYIMNHLERKEVIMVKLLIKKKTYFTPAKSPNHSLIIISPDGKRMSLPLSIIQAHRLGNMGVADFITE